MLLTETPMATPWENKPMINIGIVVYFMYIFTFMPFMLLHLMACMSTYIYIYTLETATSTMAELASSN